MLAGELGDLVGVRGHLSILSNLLAAPARIPNNNISTEDESGRKRRTEGRV
jgi:hypothetical protein